METEIQTIGDLVNSNYAYGRFSFIKETREKEVKVVGTIADTSMLDQMRSHGLQIWRNAAAKAEMNNWLPKTGEEFTKWVTL